MGNKTIYVKHGDENVYKEAQRIAGEALSSVISRALREFVDRSKALKGEMREIVVNVGPKDKEREQRFIGNQVGKWKGFSKDKEYWQTAKIYETQKGNAAILLTTVCKANFAANPSELKKNPDALKDSSAELLIAKKPKDLKDKISADLLKKVEEALKKEEKKIEYLDI
ncbi:EXLDI protein [candidate division WS5 bacterium]|uniref:EXLDI protein n=1 Tax=candidate division WS5 bacterium TaxID=2093353 RepID=A0A419DFR8_9BACT|nr:MAG: EXLDI protein [candidate division WS5 bacterium]